MASEAPPPPLDYETPSWACPPCIPYRLEVIKNGQVIEELDFEPVVTTDHLVLGRLPFCDLRMDHGSISRYHAVLQFGPEGAFIYDLDSAHGTFLNKMRLEARRHIPLPQDAVLRFGGSSRLHVLTALSPPDNTTAAWESDPLGYLRRWLQSREESLESETERAEDSADIMATIHVPRSLVPGQESALVDPSAEARGPSKKAALQAAARSMCELLASAGAFEPEAGRRRVTAAERLREEREADEDSFYDRTEVKRPRFQTRRVETAAGLYEQQSSLTQTVDELQCRIGEAQSLLATPEGEEDDIDAVLMAASRLQAKKDLARLHVKLGEAEAELQRVQRLLAIADPKGEQRPSERTAAPMPSQRGEREESTHIEQSLDSPVPARREQDKQRSPSGKASASIAEDTEEDWLPPEAAESEAALHLKAKYGY